MKRSPLSTPRSSRPHGIRHRPYDWKSHENANNRGYHSVENDNYQRFSVNNELQPCGSNFIPLNVNTPEIQHEKHNAHKHSPAGGRNSISPGSGCYWYNNYRNNYRTIPRSSCNNRYSAYKYSGRQFHGQKRKDYKGIRKQVNISAYVDINSFLEDPWEDLVKKLNNSKGTSKSGTLKNELLSDPKLADSDCIDKSKSKFVRNTNLDDSQYSQGSKNEYSIDICSEAENTDISQITTVNSSIDLEISDIHVSPDSLNENTCNINDKNYEAIQEKDNTHLKALQTDINQKNI